MIKRRNTPDGLPYRVYASLGKRVWRIYYQPLGQPRVDLFCGRAGDCTEDQAKRKAIQRYAEITHGTPAAPQGPTTFGDLVDLYFAHQDTLSDEERKAATTLAENRREAARLVSVFGEMLPAEITAAHWYEYQDVRRKRAGPKSNKEIALGSAILEYGRRRGLLEVNTAKGIKRVKTRPHQRRLTLEEIDAVMPFAQAVGPSAVICLLAVRAAYLCLRRPGEILALQVGQLEAEGIRFVAGKRKAGEPERTGLMLWSDELRATIEASRAIKRRVDISGLVFGNLMGRKYTKSGFGTNWGRLMAKASEGIAGFQPFTLRDGRPGGVTEKQSRGDRDTQDATMHTDQRMIATIYDRRRVRKATPSA
jgi:integrase